MELELKSGKNNAITLGPELAYMASGLLQSPIHQQHPYVVLLKAGYIFGSAAKSKDKTVNSSKKAYNEE